MLRRLLPLVVVDLVFLPAIAWAVLSGWGREPTGIATLTMLHLLIAGFVGCNAVAAWVTLIRPPRELRVPAERTERRR